MPPPLPLQADSPRIVPDELRFNVVPPTDRTLGETAGYDGGAPSSPDAVTKVTPEWPLGVVKLLSQFRSRENSPPPQLIDTATTPGRDAAKRTAAFRFENESSLASTSKMFAPG